MKDPYRVLGVSPRAGQEEIKRAFRRLAREMHPDSHPDDPGAEEEFKQLNAAYDLLRDPDRRAAFDRGEIDAQGREKRKRPGAGAGAGRARSPFDDFFRSQDGRRRSSIKVKGANVEYNLKIPFVDAVAGTTRRVGMTTGKHLEVRVPPGTRDGQVLRLKGQGMSGIGGGEAGDALIEISVEPHPNFRREGDDIHIEVPVSLGEALLGAKIEVPTVEGPVMVGVPPGSNTGTRLRLKGKGAPVNGGAARGDQYVALKVVLPQKPDDELVAFVKKWSERNPYEVRPKKAPVE